MVRCRSRNARPHVRAWLLVGHRGQRAGHDQRDHEGRCRRHGDDVDPLDFAAATYRSGHLGLLEILRADRSGYRFSVATTWQYCLPNGLYLALLKSAAYIVQPNLQLPPASQPQLNCLPASSVVPVAARKPHSP